MNKFHEALRILILQEESGSNLDEKLENNIHSVCTVLDINPELQNFSDIQNPSDTVRWKYLSLSFHVLLSVKSDESLVNINYINDVKKTFQFIVSIGILPNLIPGVGIDINKRLKNVNKICDESFTQQEKYYILSGSIKGLLLCLKLDYFRNLIIANHFNDLLAAMLQLCNAPLIKPNNTKNKFNMTEDFYSVVIIDRQFFQIEFNKLLCQSYTPQIIQELMFFYGNSDSPRWLKSVVYKLLIQKLQSTDGVESLIKAVFDSENLDTGRKWKQYDVIVKLLMTSHVQAEEKYFENICSQLLKLLDKKDQSGKIISHFVQILASCIKYLYEKNKNMCEKYFLNCIFQKLLQYSSKTENKISNGIITNEIKQIGFLLFLCFVETSATSQSLPINLLNPIIAIIFYLFIALHKSTHSKLTENLKSILLSYISNSEKSKKKYVFEAFLFGAEKNEILQLKDNIQILINTNNELQILIGDTKIRLNPLIRSEALLELIKDTDVENIIVPLCLYLLQTSIDSKLTTKSNTDLLQLENENEMILNTVTEHKLVSYSLLSNLLEKGNVQKHLQKHPDNILNFIENTLKNFTNSNVHKSTNCDSEQFQNMFLLIMILNILSENSNHIFLSDTLKNTLNLVYNETVNNEVKNLISSIINSKDLQSKPKVQELSEYAKALEDICDPVLPVRGHGLMTLAKLIEEKNPEVCANKQYILNICQQNIRNDDSYIYLSAIKVLAALGDSFPDIIINILTEEYSNGSKELFEKDSETKMKLGEVLLRVVKSLGEIAPKYKSILLNTFLTGVRDEDHLIRASSLSNLGEICRVLGYKLGTIVTEILSCIHAVIATDKAVEARRAAVSVIRYLFVGLEKETIIFLKEEILPIYRTLKLVYKNDPDDVTRLQAQLALEELNVNVRDYIFPSVTLEKKIVMLN